jgi:hypothetical protein
MNKTFFAASLDRHMFMKNNNLYDMQIENLIPDFCDDLELDLRCSKLLSEKCKNSKEYSYKLYSSLCNNKFKKNNNICSYSFRVVSGIVANLNESGDYIDWYCSGYEGLINQEVIEDLNSLGWELHVKQNEKH